MANTIKETRKEFKKMGKFYTDPKLVDLMYSYVDFDYKNIYDPTCGTGALFSKAKKSVKIYGQDKDPEAIKQVKQNYPNAEIEDGDTLEHPKFLNKSFDLIMANPPFSIKWNDDGKRNDPRFYDAPCLPPKSKADYAFILHILYMLNNQGKAIVLNFPGIAYRGQREGKIRKWLIKNNYIERVVSIPGGYFEDTTISTLLIIFDKNKKTTNIIFEDLETKKEKNVKLKEVQENDYNLSVTTYIPPEVKKEKIDPLKLQREIETLRKKRLQKEKELDKLVYQLENLNFQDELIF